MEYNSSTEKSKTNFLALVRGIDTKSIMVGIIIGLIVGGIVGFVAPSSHIKNLNSQIEELNTDVSSLEAQTTQLQQEVETLQGETNTLQTTLQTRVNEVEVKNTEINGLNEQVQQLQGQINQLNTQLIELNATSVSFSKYNQLEENYEELLSSYHITLSDNAKKQEKIQEFNNIIKELEDKIDILQEFYNVPPGTWKTIKSWTGSIDMTTELFYVPSNQIKVTWNLDVEKYSSCSIWLYDEQNEYIASWISIHEQPEGETYAHVTPGYYYLEIDVLNVDYYVTVETMFE